jgi:excisionase family DNA binding protein
MEDHRRRFLSVSEVAAALGVSERSVRERLHHRDPLTGRHVIPSVRFGRRVLVPRVWLDSFVASAEAEARP